MGARRLPLTALPRRELALAAAAGLTTALIAYAGAHKFGTVGLLVPLVVLLALTLLARPLLAVSLVTFLVVFCEGQSFGLLTFSSKLYEIHFKDITLLDGLVALAIASVALELVRTRRPAAACRGR